MTHDLVSIGECLVELSPGPGEDCFRHAWAGDAVNTLFYAGRLGLRTGFISSFGDDLFTGMIRDGINHEGIDLAMTEVIPGRRNGLYVIELDDDGEYTFHFWRDESAATRTLIRCDIEALRHYCSRSSWLLLSGITMAVMKEQQRLIDLLLWLRSRAETHIVFDTNYRPQLWDSSDHYRYALEEIVPFVDLFLPSERDLHLLWPQHSADEIIRRYGCRQTALKRGAEGCTLFEGEEQYDVSPPCQVRPVDTTGAGDAFNAGMLTGLIRGEKPIDAARLGMQVAAHVVGVQGAIDPDFHRHNLPSYR